LKQVGLAVYTLAIDSRLMRFLWEVYDAKDQAIPWTPGLADEYTFRMVDTGFGTMVSWLS
jgi:hypothetical protein